MAKFKRCFVICDSIVSSGYCDTVSKHRECSGRSAPSGTCDGGDKKSLMLVKLQSNTSVTKYKNIAASVLRFSTNVS